MLLQSNFSTECPCYSYMQYYHTFVSSEILFLIRIAFACTFFFVYMYVWHFRLLFINENGANLFVWL